MLDMEIVIRPLAVCSTPPPHGALHFRVEWGKSMNPENSHDGDMGPEKPRYRSFSRLHSLVDSLLLKGQQLLFFMLFRGALGKFCDEFIVPLLPQSCQ